MTSIGLAGLSLGQYNVQNSTNSEIDNYTTYSPFLSTRVGPILPIYLVNDASARAETAGNKMLIYGGLAAIPGIILLIDYYYFKPEVQAKSDVSGFNWDFKMTPLSPYRPGLNGNRSFENQMTFDYTILF